MDDYIDIGDYKICVSYTGHYYVYYCGGKTITPAGLDLADALIFVGAHMKSHAGKPRFDMEELLWELHIQSQFRAIKRSMLASPFVMGVVTEESIAEVNTMDNLKLL